MEKIQLIEILTEFISGVYGRQLSKVLKQGLETDVQSSFDVAYTISDTQDNDLVLDTLNQLDLESGVLLHSDQGSVYTSHAYYLACIEKGITRSMSRKGTPADNACIEWFHSALKTEAFYLQDRRKHNKVSITNIVKNYITFYNETRIQRHLKNQSPVQFRKLVS